MSAPDPTGESLGEVSIAHLCEHLAERLKVKDAEIRISVKDGLYQRAKVVLPISALPR